MKTQIIVFLLAISAPAMATDCAPGTKKSMTDILECDIRLYEEIKSSSKGRSTNDLLQYKIDNRRLLLDYVKQGKLSKNDALETLEKDKQREERYSERLDDRQAIRRMLMEIELTCTRQPDGSSRCTAY